MALQFFGRRSRRVSPADIERLHRKTITIHSPGGALRASAARLDVSDKGEAKVQRMLRQGWQSEAWNYRDAIGELRYAANFLANTTARMRLFPACYPIGGESDEPVKLDDAAGIPDNVVSLCAQAMQELGNGRMALGGMMHQISTNKTIAGEGWLLSRTDENGQQTWSVRSVDELVVYDDVWHLREIPDDRQNSAIPWIPLDPEHDVISRMWTPHPRFQILADAPTRAMLDDLESLGILRRMIRAAGRSRLARSGVFAVPEGFSIKLPMDDDEDPEADAFMSGLTQAMMAPVVNEGTADSFVPIIIRGPGELINQIKQFDFSLDFDKMAADTRAELLGIMARTLDMPAEILTGIQDVNHWTAWQISDDTFRQIEPHVIACCDDLSAAYLRPYLAAEGVPDFWVERMVLWYDPSEVINHPDRTKDAEAAYGAMAISGKAYREAAGFAESDAPSAQELEMRRVMDIRALPLNLLMEYARRFDPTLVVPPIEVAGTVPGIKLGGVDIGTPVGPGAATPGAPPAAPAASEPRPELPAGIAPPGPPPATSPPRPALTASGGRDMRRLSRKLATIDSNLRARLQTAANAAMLRQLERAGAKLRPKVAKDETLRARIAHRANERVPALLGPEVIAAAGFTPDDLINGDWATLRAQFYSWTEAAQNQALAAALTIGRVDPNSDAAARARQAMNAGRDVAWGMLAQTLTSTGQDLLYSPDPNTPAGDWGDLNPDTLVSAGTIRSALAIAGGAALSQFGDTGTATLDRPVGQIGTGQTVTDLIVSGDAEATGYSWVHGPSLNVFEPHEELDGIEFATFDDPQLENHGDWPPVEFYLPGDHDGCLCDFMPIYSSPEE